MTPAADAPTLTANFRLGWEDQALEATVSVPAGPTRPRVLLPMIQRLTNELVGMGEAQVAARGEAVSCRAGCGACCRQVVPVSETEARHLRDLVAAMPEPRRAVVRDRFTDGLRRLADGGLGDAVRDPLGVTDTTAFGLAYFRLGVACPFLEGESCSIHPDRPLSCREFLVTSPAANCSDPTPETIRRVPTPGHAMTSFAALDGLRPDGARVRWVPLIAALEWADAHPEPPDATETGPELFGRFMTTLTRHRIPPPADLTAPPPEPHA